MVCQSSVSLKAFWRIDYGDTTIYRTRNSEYKSLVQDGNGVNNQT